MHWKNSLPLPEKLEMVSEKLKHPASLLSESEGSQVLVLTVNPSQEPAALDALQLRFPGKLELLNLGSKLTQVATDYGMENLEEDFSFFGKGSIQDFSKLFLSAIIQSIQEASQSASLTVVHRLGILNGFFGLNPLIEGVTGKLANPALFLYPGKRKEHILSFLEGRHTTSLYRAIVL
ncbi:MAG TPA: hypothetical protein PLF96_12405 [Thermotogota bacterium]|nr:hypothetical protein [Thermotogota bacterium]